VVELMPVISSNVQAVGYDGDSATLVVEYRMGTRYAYTAVPNDVWAGLVACHMAGESIGRYVHQHVKGVYAHTRLPRDAE
jgi:hypothetical protein